mgnify:CR=1 FL=1
MYCSWGQRPTPSVDGWGMVWMIVMAKWYPGKICGLNFLTFVLQLRKNPGKTSSRKLTLPGFEPEPADDRQLRSLSTTAVVALIEIFCQFFITLSANYDKKNINCSLIKIFMYTIKKLIKHRGLYTKVKNIIFQKIKQSWFVLLTGNKIRLF